MRDHGPLCSSLGLREQECGAALIVEDQPATPARSSGELSLDEGRNELKSKVLDRIYCQSANPGFSGPCPALEILRRPQNRDAVDSFPVQMLEMPCVAGQEIVCLPVDRG